MHEMLPLHILTAMHNSNKTQSDQYKLYLSDLERMRNDRIFVAQIHGIAFFIYSLYNLYYDKVTLLILNIICMIIVLTWIFTEKIFPLKEFILSKKPLPHRVNVLRSFMYLTVILFSISFIFKHKLLHYAWMYCFALWYIIECYDNLSAFYSRKKL